jgi:hypothetical protein
VTNLRRLLRVTWDRHDCREDFRSHDAALHALGDLHRRVRENGVAQFVDECADACVGNPTCERQLRRRLARSTRHLTVALLIAAFSLSKRLPRAAIEASGIVARKLSTVVTAESQNGLTKLITEIHEAATDAKARGYPRTARRLDECGFELAAMISGTDPVVASSARRARTSLAV